MVNVTNNNVTARTWKSKFSGGIGCYTGLCQNAESFGKAPTLLIFHDKKSLQLIYMENY